MTKAGGTNHPNVISIQRALAEERQAGAATIQSRENFPPQPGTTPSPPEPPSRER